MTPQSHPEHRNAVLQYRWFYTGRGSPCFGASGHAPKCADTPSWRAHSHQSDRSHNVTDRIAHAAETPFRACRTPAPYLKSP
jgi:hypothetical protein